MLKISDFSKLTHVSVRMLRYYDSQGMLKPSKVDPENGYRMYGAEQVPELQKIVLLRDLNFSVAEMKELLKNWEESYLSERFQSKITEIEEEITTANRKITQLQSAMEHIKKHQLEQYYNVTLRAIPDYPVISLRRRVKNYFEEGILWGELCEYVHKNHIEIDHSARNNIAVYHDDEYVENGVDIEVCFVVPKIGESNNAITYRILEGVEQMACMMVYGPYTNIAGAYGSFTKWMEENVAYQMGAPSRQITIIDRKDTDNPDEYLTEIQIPLQHSIIV